MTNTNLLENRKNKDKKATRQFFCAIIGHWGQRPFKATSYLKNTAVIFMLERMVMLFSMPAVGGVEGSSRRSLRAKF